MKNQVHLITYANRIGGNNLASLHRLLTGPFKGLLGGVHILPFFSPIDGADTGFDPIDHTMVDPRLGSWSHIEALSQDINIMADMIVNHISTDSPQFKDFLEKGEGSPYSRLFLTMAAVFPDGASEEELLKIYRPRPALPFSVVTLKDRTRRLLWTTFTSKQADINVLDKEGKAYLNSILQAFQKHGIHLIRLDAVGYAIKKAGTSCFMIPETFDFITEITRQSEALGMEVLVEVHSHYLNQIAIAKHVSRVYDFALPPLVLHAFYTGTAQYLKKWLAISPRNAVTVLDTHDGIGVIDIGEDAAGPVRSAGLIPSSELERLVDTIHERSGGQSKQASAGGASNLDLYQVNCTYYDALGRNNRQYLLARAIQFFTPGVPQVYYVGLLAGENDMTLLAQTGVGRDINRHYFGWEEVEKALLKPVVRDLVRLIRFRNEHPAFQGEFTLRNSEDTVLEMRWDNEGEWANLIVNFQSGDFELQFSQAGAVEQLHFYEQDY